MNLQPTEEQRELASSAASFLAESSRRDDWTATAELGWLALSVPEEDGGVGIGLPDEVMLFRELGRQLARGPFLSSVLGARVAVEARDQSLIEAIISGQRRVGLAVDGYAIDARPGELILNLNDRGGQILEVKDHRPIESVDPTVDLSTGVRSDPIASIEDVWLLPRARVLAAAELLGITEAVMDMSTDYAKIRVQFGKPIGSFQAVKHRCADMAISLFECVGQLHQAALLVENEKPDGHFHAAVAYLLAIDGAKQSTLDNIQNHGGIGFTWEHRAHRYLKRALVLETVLGDRRSLRQAILAPRAHEF